MMRVCKPWRVCGVIVLVGALVGCRTPTPIEPLVPDETAPEAIRTRSKAVRGE